MAKGRKTGLVISLAPEERNELESWRRSRTIPAGLARRARAILMLAAGRTVSDVARELGTQRRFVYRWAERFLRGRLAGLQDRPGRGRKPRLSAC